MSKKIEQNEKKLNEVEIFDLYKNDFVTKEDLLPRFKTKSEEIRYRSNVLNESRSAISKRMGIRYQHVRNVLVTPLKK